MRTESVVRSSMGKMLGRRFPRRLPVFSTLPTRPRVSQRTQSKVQAMPDFLEASFGTVSPLEAATPGPNGAFSPVEHCWHLADLEREGYAVRIRRLLEEDNPGLPDFDGARIARERSYTSLSLAEGIDAFRA